MDASVLDSLRKMRGDELGAFLDRELLKLPIRDRARHTLEAIIRLAPDLETWRGSWSQLAAAVVALKRTTFSAETVKRAIKELRTFGLIDASGTNGAACTYRVQWLALLDMRYKPLIELHEEPAQDQRTRSDQPRSPAQRSGGDHGHLTTVKAASLTAVTPDRGHPLRPSKTPFRGPPDHGHLTAVSAPADAVLERCISKSASAGAVTVVRTVARTPLWGRSIEHAEWRDPEALIPELWERVVHAGLANGGEEDRQAFASLCVHIAERRGCRNRTGLLTTILQGRGQEKFGRGWRDLATIPQQEAARLLLKRIDCEAEPPRDAYSDQLQAANEDRRSQAKDRLRQMQAMRAMAGSGG